MSEILQKIKRNSKKVALISSLFLAVFIGLFYLVNLDINPNKNQANIVQNNIQNANTDEQIKKLAGSIDFSFAGYDDWAKANDLTRSKDPNLDPDKDNLPNYLEYIYGTDPLKADTDGDGYSDKQEIINGYDPDAPGDAKPLVIVDINKIGAEAPMVWSQSTDENKMLADLENGISHYYKSASPGQNGNMIISGHSSNYIWAKGDYNHIFKDLNSLENGDEIVVTTLQKNGRVITFHYQVADKFITAPDDGQIFAETSDPTITLSTCWPLGTNFRRLIIKGNLVK
jgi:LPXTG-site transpeptidase (sortase) family protein